MGGSQLIYLDLPTLGSIWRNLLNPSTILYNDLDLKASLKPHVFTWSIAWSIASSTLVHLFWFLRCCSLAHEGDDDGDDGDDCVFGDDGVDSGVDGNYGDIWWLCWKTQHKLS